jgi:conjugal transfer/type IV secretion protein DotA/TraY
MRAKFLTALAAIAASLMSASAQAAPELFEVSCSDRSMSDYLVPLFGSLFESCGGAAGAIESALGVFNAGVLTVGGVLAAYMLVAGIMQTAQDGEMLGKRWSSMWLPLRTVLGIGLVVPVGKGYCVAQLIVGFLIGQGVGFADKTWDAWLTAYSKPEGMAPRSHLPNVSELAQSVLVSQTCVAAFNAMRESGAQGIYATPMGASTPAAGVRAYGINGGAQCGAVRYESGSKIGQTIAGWVGLDYESAPLSAVEQAHVAALTEMEGKLAQTGKRVVDSVQDGASGYDVAADVAQAVDAYQKRVAASAESVFGNQAALDSFRQAASKDGWMFAGAYYSKAVQLQDALSTVIAHTPTATRPNPRALPKDLAPYFVRLDAMLDQSASPLSAGAAAAADIGNTSSPLAQGAQKAMNAIFGGDWIAAKIQADKNRAALMSVKDFGDYLMTGAETGIGVGVVMAGSAEAIRAENDSFIGEAANVATLGASKAIAGASSGALHAVGYLLIFACSVLFCFAAGIAIYLPFAPFLIFFGAFVGWVLLCCEAVIAAPLWALWHLIPEGDGIAGAARQGYMLLLGVLLRPTLLVLGFVCSLTALNVIAQGFNAVFFPAFKLASAGSVVGLGSSLVMIAIYFGAMVWLFHFVFGFVSAIPDKLLRWIGGGREQLGESAQALSQTGQAGAASTGRSVSDASGKTMSAMATKAAMDARSAAQKSRGGEPSGASEAKRQSMQQKPDKPGE